MSLQGEHLLTVLFTSTLPPLLVVSITPLDQSTEAIINPWFVWFGTSSGEGDVLVDQVIKTIFEHSPKVVCAERAGGGIGDGV